MNAAPLVLLALFAGIASGQGPQKRIYIACDDHTDYMWTADEETYKQAFLEMLDWYLDLADATQGNPPDQQSRFACDGTFWLTTYEKSKSPQEFQRLIDRIKSGHISAPMTTLVSCFGAQSIEAVLRGMYAAGRFERKHGFRFRMAVAMENQTLPWGLASLFAGSGAWYSWKGICGCASKIPDAWDREHDIYNWVGPDGKKLLMKWNSNLLHGTDTMGGYAETRTPGVVVPYVSTDFAFQSRYPFPVIGCFGKGADDLKTLTSEFPAASFNLSNAQRRVIVSNAQDFFDDFDANYGAGLPAVAASFGNEWDLYSASMAEVSANAKRSVEQLRGAEAMATLVSVCIPSFASALAAERDQAFTDLGLFWEHDWTADGPVPKSARAAWQRKLAMDIHGYAAHLEDASNDMLGRLIATSPDAVRFYVFNPLGRTRTDVADLPVTFQFPLLTVVDVSTGAQVPCQYVTIDGKDYLRILAEDVPPVGYRAYEIQNDRAAMFGVAAVFDNGSLQNSEYRVKIDPRGAITSLVDTAQNGREFAVTLNGLAINDFGPSPGTLTLEESGPVSVTVRADAPFPVQHTTWITLFRDGRRIEIRNRVTQNFGATLTNGFTFNLLGPEVQHEEIGAIARAKLVSQGGHYADKCARYDWLSLNHFADVIGDDGACASLSNADSSFFRLGNSTTDYLDTSTPQLRVLLGGQVDGPGLGIPNQDGDSDFLQRFAISTYPTHDPVQSMRASLEHQNPLRCGLITGSVPLLPPSSYSLVSISNPNVLLWALKPAEEGIQDGVIARLWNLDGSAQAADIALAAPFSIGDAFATTHLETNELHLPVAAGRVTATFAPHEIRTFRLLPGHLGPP